MTFHSETPLDATDWHILRELQEDARLSYRELGQRVALSAPAVAERIRKLEDRGIITRYSIQIDPAKVGLPLMVFVQMHCDPAKCLLKTSSAAEFPEIREMHKLSGNYCTMLKVVVSSMQHLEAFNERLGKHGDVTVHLVTSSVFTDRMLDWEAPDIDTTLTENPDWQV
jgi:Lrp/AsnC family transcriptional regulator, leucine-responsive regulatory protein